MQHEELERTQVKLNLRQLFVERTVRQACLWLEPRSIVRSAMYDEPTSSNCALRAFQPPARGMFSATFDMATNAFWVAD